MRFALSSGSLYTYGTERVFALTAEAGFDGIEVLVDHRFDTRQADYLRRLMERYDLPIFSVHAPFWPDRMPFWPDTQPESIAATAELANAVGAEVIVVHLPLRGENSFAQWLREDMHAWQQAHPKPRIGLENMPKKWQRWWPFAPVEFWQMNRLEEWGEFPALTLDTTHLGTKGWDILDIYQRLRDRVIHVHLSNARRVGRRVQEHCRLEDGFLPLGRLIGRLERDHYAGTVTVELNPRALNAEDESLVRRHLRRQAVFCQQNRRTL